MTGDACGRPTTTCSITRTQERCRLRQKEEREFKPRDLNLITGIAKRLYLERKYDFEDQAHYFQLKIDAMTTSVKRGVFDTGLFGGGMVTLFMIICAGIIGAAPSKCICSSSNVESGAAKKSSVGQLQQQSSWTAPPPPATDHGGHEKQDVWKQHICSMPCIDCNQLLIACTDFGAEGACILHKSRCNYVSNYTKREEYSLCEPGCLNCLAMRYGCYYHQDPGLCITYNDYCIENSFNIAEDLGTERSTIEQEFIEELLRDYERSLSTYANRGQQRRRRQRRKEQQHADAYRSMNIEERSCAELNKSCKTGKSFMNYLDCLEWFVRCNL